MARIRGYCKPVFLKLDVSTFVSLVPKTERWTFDGTQLLQQSSVKTSLQILIFVSIHYMLLAVH